MEATPINPEVVGGSGWRRGYGRQRRASCGYGVSGEPLAAAPAVQALQPLIDGALMASSTYLESLFAALAEAQGDMQNAEKNQQAKVGTRRRDADVRGLGRRADGLEAARAQ